MVKRVICAVLLFCICVCAASCGSGVEVPNGMKTASGEKDLFYLFVPASWTVMENQSFATAIYSAGDTSSIQVIIYDTFNRNDTGTTAAETDGTTAAVTTGAVTGDERRIYIDSFWNGYVQENRGVFTDFTEVTDERADTTLGGYLAKRYVYTIKMNGETLKYCVVVTYYGGLMFVLQLTAKSDNYNSHIEDFNNVAKEFLFK